MSEESHETMECDVCIVGAGAAGLSSAIRLMQRAQASGKTLNVIVLEKGAEVGAHILSGAALEPRALNELLPDWKNLGAPLNVPCTKDEFRLLTKTRSFKLPTPPGMDNHGNYVISLGNFCRWLAQQAETLGVQIFPGFSAASLIVKESRVKGVRTGAFGVAKDGSHKHNYQPPMEIRAGFTLFAEGCRGSLGRQLTEQFNLRQHSDPQTYAIGIKELWRIDAAKHEPGKTIHTIGWPLESDTYGGSFVYHGEDQQLAIGYVVALDYSNPYLDPYLEFQRFKNHPSIRPLLEGGTRLSYGARALSEGGYQSLPKLTFPGGALIGDNAGFLNVPKIKGTHMAMKSGMVAADTIADAIAAGSDSLDAYTDNLKQSWLWNELKSVRNIRPAFRHGLWLGLLYAALDTYLFRGKAPWTLRNHADHKSIKKAKDSKKIDYPRPDGVVTFDRLSSVYISGTNHEENQPVHLTLKDASIPVSVNLAEYAGPEQRYCPAGVYEFVPKDSGEGMRLQINAQNCVHCKTCDIKDPTQNIVWVTPEGGGGPNYGNM